MTALEAATEYVRRGWSPIPIGHREKRCLLDDWPQLRISEIDLPKHFGSGPKNIGIVLGKASRGLMDVDLDDESARVSAPFLLPKTGAVFGRRSNPSSHYLYQVSGPARSRQFSQGGMIVELRGDGHQTVFPSSVHESGEPIEWATDGVPAVVEYELLLQSVTQVAAAALIARSWSEGSHNTLNANLIGALLHSGWVPEKIEPFIRAICAAAGDDKVEKRIARIADLDAALTRNGAVPHWPQAAAMMETGHAKQVAQWLKLRNQPEPETLVRLLGPDEARIRSDLFERPPLPPAMTIAGFEARDVGLVPGEGGVGKTTLELLLAIHRILGYPVFGCEILQPGPVLIVTAEDSRNRIEYRLYRLCEALALSRDEQKRVLAGIHVEDLSTRRWRLVQEAHGLLMPTSLAGELSDQYATAGLSAVVFDPLVYFGPGERFVNDGEAEIMHAGRAVARSLNCAVRFPHHTGKGQARDGMDDQYAGRGGSAGSDNARFVHVVTVHKTDKAGRWPAPAAVMPGDIAAGNLLRYRVAKLTDAKVPDEPFFLVRHGWKFEHILPREDDETRRRDRAMSRTCDFVRSELDRGVKHSPSSLERAHKQVGVSRDDLRVLINEAVSQGLLALVELPKAERHGRLKNYLIAVGDEL